jgi:hypothetical protein
MNLPRSGWTFDRRRAPLPEIEARGWLTQLFADLDDQLADVPLPCLFEHRMPTGRKFRLTAAPR